ncbi:MAG: hypothetical protein M3O31_06110 [Acidobacteriota bacterium]|nr:hypothetical protein [Acidobacteriota bacterium]
MTQHAGLSGAGFVVFFVVMWMLAGALVGMVAGWRSLAERYRTERRFPAHRRWMQSARMRAGVGYNNVLTLGSDAEGIYLKVFVLFRFSHLRCWCRGLMV